MAVSRDIDCCFMIPRDWLKIDNDDIDCFYQNPSAISLTEKKINELDNINWEELCSNPNAISLIEKNIDMLEYDSWYKLCGLPHATHLIEKNINNLNKVNMIVICGNSGAFHLVEENLNKNINYYELHPDVSHYLFDDKTINELCKNTKAIQLIKNNIEQLDVQQWKILNKNPNAIKILKQHPDKIDYKYLYTNPNAYMIFNNFELYFNGNDCELWKYISMCPSAIKLLESNQDKINWTTIGANFNAIHLIENNMDKINNIDMFLLYLSDNYNAIHILEKYSNKITDETWEHYHEFWECFYTNPAIFTYNYKKITEIKNNINKNIIEWTWKPENINKWHTMAIEFIKKAKIIKLYE